MQKKLLTKFNIHAKNKKKTLRKVDIEGTYLFYCFVLFFQTILLTIHFPISTKI